MSNPPLLNKSQREAVEILSGPMLVLAGAGTGKTRVVTFRIAKLIRHGTPANRILAVTFTKKAAREMRQRVSQLLGRRTKATPLVCTFHSLCVRVLRRHIDRLGFPRNFVILDRSEQESHARMALREIRVAEHVLSTGDLYWTISRWKSHGVLPRDAEQMATTDKQHLAAIAYRRYVELLEQAGALDFDDLLLFTERLFREHPKTLDAEAGSWDHVLIDEYQDTNGEQYKIVQQLTRRHRNLCVVGDDDQSIYGWRGAQLQHILNFRGDWPDAKVIRLEDNYRSTAEILELANRLIEHNRGRHEKQLRPVRSGGPTPRVLQMADESQEAADVVRQIRAILQRPEVQPSDVAILFRTNEQPRSFETELRRVGLPYVLIGGQAFFDRKEIKDLLAYFRLIDNPRDEMAARRIINTPPRGIGKTTVAAAAETALARGISFWECLRLPELKVAPATRQKIAALVSLVERARAELGSRPNLVDWARRWIRELNYRAEIDRLYSDAIERESRWAAVEQLVSALGQFVAEEGERGTMTQFLDQIAVGDREQEIEKDKQLGRNAIMLLTLHSAKGLEFPYVFMVGMEEGILPHQRSLDDGPTALEEERRLCYVGVTRAREQLTFSLALSRMKWGKSRESRPSRFLYEMTNQTSNPNYQRVQETKTGEVIRADKPASKKSRPSKSRAAEKVPVKSASRASRPSSRSNQRAHP